MEIVTKRVYDDPEPSDGYRVLTDRLWPRGMTRERAALDLWLKDVAPSTDLRRWFDHRAERYDEFATRYRAELAASPLVADLMEIVTREPRVTLLFATASTEMNQAVVLADHLRQLASP